MAEPRGPVLFEADALSPAEETPATAPPPPDPGASAMGRVAQAAAAPPSPLARLIWGALGGLVLLWVSVSAWDFAAGLVARNAVLGWLAAALALAAGAGLVIAAVSEILALRRLRRIDALQRRAARAAATGDLAEAREVTAAIRALYARRPERAAADARLAALAKEVLDADALLAGAEATLADLDAKAEAVVTETARRVATLTALVPLAAADVLVALFANLRMVRHLAQIYGGRAGFFGSVRLMRAVAAHLVATGAIAVGDDLFGSMLGGGVMSKLSRRFGEGVVNGALTVRVGIAAMEVCRPLGFATPPRLGRLTAAALSGVFKGRG